MELRPKPKLRESIKPIMKLIRRDLISVAGIVVDSEIAGSTKWDNAYVMALEAIGSTHVNDETTYPALYKTVDDIRQTIYFINLGVKYESEKITGPEGHDLADLMNKLNRIENQTDQLDTLLKMGT